MIHKVGQIMLYVNDQDAAAAFWTSKLGFRVISEDKQGDMRWIEVAPEGAETSLVLHNKTLVAQMSPELHLGTPSLMLFASDVDALYAKLAEQNVKVGEMVQLPAGKVFNFADEEDNYFAVMESK